MYTDQFNVSVKTKLRLLIKYAIKLNKKIKTSELIKNMLSITPEWRFLRSVQIFTQWQQSYLQAQKLVSLCNFGKYDKT